MMLLRLEPKRGLNILLLTGGLTHIRCTEINASSSYPPTNFKTLRLMVPLILLSRRNKVDSLQFNSVYLNS